MLRTHKNGSRRAERLALVLCGAVLMAMLIGFHAVAKTDQPVAHTSCTHITPESGSPCKAGNIFVECGYRFGACQNDRGTKYFRCKISGELGKTVKVVEDPKEGLEGTRIQNPHKVVTCKGSATILAAYSTNGKRASLGGFKAVGHGRHTLKVTLYLRKNNPGLDVLAQH